MTVAFILFYSIGLAAAALILLRYKKYSLSKFQYVKIFCISLLLTLASLFISSSRMSGSGFSTAYGWPHEFYTVWKSFDGLSQNKGLSGGLLYIASNLFFYFSTIFFLSCLFFKKKV